MQINKLLEIRGSNEGCTVARPPPTTGHALSNEVEPACVFGASALWEGAHTIKIMPRTLILQDFLPYLLNRAGLRVGLMFSADIEKFDVTLPMWRVMIALWHNGGHRLGELARRTSIDLSTLSRLLVTMQRKGLVVRRRSGLDGRALSLTLTEHGMKLTEQVIPIALYYEDVAMRKLSNADVKKLKDLLKVVYANLEAAEQKKLSPPKEARARAKVRADQKPNNAGVKART
jgi:MarR family transcriptional regulator, organic hydroperoxide resistance regulator